MAPDGRTKLDDYFEPGKRLLGDPSFLDSIVHFDREAVPDATLDELRARCIGREDFGVEHMRMSSAAALGLCRWIHGVDAYERVTRSILEAVGGRPTLAAAAATLDEARALLPPGSLEPAMDDDEIASVGTEWSCLSLASGWSHLSRDSVWHGVTGGGDGGDDDDDARSVQSDWSEVSAAAFAALSCVNKSDLYEIKSLKQPGARGHGHCAGPQANLVVRSSRRAGRARAAAVTARV